MSLQVLPEPSCWKVVDSVIIKETLFVIVSSRRYHVRVKASGKALFGALIHLPHAAQFIFWAPNDRLSREAFGRCVGACAAWRCSRGSPRHGPEQPRTCTRRQHRHSAVTSHHRYWAQVFTFPYCHWNIVILNRRGRGVPFLVLLLFVLLLVCLCVMFLLIKDGIFFSFFWKGGKDPSLDFSHKYWQNSLYGRRKTKVIMISTWSYLGSVSVKLVSKL